MSVLSIGINAFGSASLDEEPNLSTWPALTFANERVQGLVDAFRDLGYAHATPGPLTSQDLGTTVTQAIKTHSQDDVIIIHIVSHGHLGNTGSLYVIGGDGRFDETTDVGVWLKLIVDKPERPFVLFLLDLCNSGTATRLSWQLKVATFDHRAWVIAAADVEGQAFNGRFTEAVTHVIRSIANSNSAHIDVDSSVRYVPLSTVAREIRRTVNRLADEAHAMPQAVVGTLIDIASDMPVLPFFPNPHYRAPHATDSLTKIDTSLIPFLDGVNVRDQQPTTVIDTTPSTLTAHQLADAQHFRDRGAGHGPFAGHVQDEMGFFTGRARELRTLSTFIDGHDTVGMRVVIGSPGVGKSALLGVLVCAAHPALREATGHVWSGVDDYPYENLHLAAVHARQRTIFDVSESISSQLFGDESGSIPENIEALLSAIRNCNYQPVIILDALDEAVDAITIMNQLILPLSEIFDANGSPACRLLVATRPWREFTPLLERADKAHGLTDLDEVPRSVLRYDIEKYVDRLMRTDQLYETVRYAGARSTFAAAVAHTLANPSDRQGTRSWGEFLVAGLYTHHILSGVERILTTAQAKRVGEHVPRSLPAILELDLTAIRSNAWVRPILTALAHARGDGIPARLAGRIAPAFVSQPWQRPAPTEVAEALGAVRFYLRSRTDTDGTTLYRLFHQGLVDYLRTRSNSNQIQAAAGDELRNNLFVRLHGALHWHLRMRGVYEYIIAAVQTPLGRDWELAEPYLLRHGLTHAGEVGQLHDLLTDPEFLVYADPEIVSPVMESYCRQAEAVPPIVQIYKSALTHGFSAASIVMRRQLMALEAARASNVDLANKLTSPVGIARCALRPRWTVGSSVAEEEGKEGTIPSLYQPVLVSGSESGRMTLYQLLAKGATGVPLGWHPDAVTAIATVTSNGRLYVVSGSRDGAVLIWDVGSRKVVGQPIADHIGPVWSVATSLVSDRLLIVTSGEDRTIRLHDLHTGEAVGEPMTGFMTGPVYAITTTEMDGHAVVIAGTREGKVLVWDLETLKMFRILGIHGGAVRTVLCPAQSGRHVVVTIGGTEVAFWDLIGQTSSPVRRDISRSIRAAAVVSIEGADMIATATDGTLDIWGTDPFGMKLFSGFHNLGSVTTMTCELLKGKAIAVLSSRTGQVRCLSLPGFESVENSSFELGERVTSLAVAELDSQSLDRWYAEQRIEVGRSNSPADAASAVTILGSAHFQRSECILSGHADGSVHIFDVQNGKVIFAARLPCGGPVKAVSARRISGRSVIAAEGVHNVATLWDVERGTILRTGDGEGKPWRQLLTPANEDIWIIRNHALVRAIGEADGRVRLESPTSAGPVITSDWFDPQYGAVTALAAGAVGGQGVLVVAGQDGVVGLWDIEELKELERLPVGSPVNAIVPLSGSLVIRSGGEVVVLSMGMSSSGHFHD